MGGGLAGPELAAAVAAAGGLGTLGLAPPDDLRESISRVRADAPGRAVAVNLLTPFLRRSHVSVCVREASMWPWLPSAVTAACRRAQ